MDVEQPAKKARLSEDFRSTAIPEASEATQLVQPTEESKGFRKTGHDAEAIGTQGGSNKTNRESKLPLSDGWKMSPWEQHSAVINLARFNYDGGKALLEGRAGFLITCGFRREKSATNEAMALLPQYLEHYQARPISTLSDSNKIERELVTQILPEIAEAKMPVENLASQSADVEQKAASHLLANTAEVHEGATVEPAQCHLDVKSDETLLQSVSAKQEQGGDEQLPRGSLALSLVKLGCMGVIFAALPAGNRDVPVDVVRMLLEDTRTERQSRLQWCQRIVPVQATCPVTLEAVRPLVVNLVRAHLDADEKLQQETAPVQYAVAYKRRGPETGGNFKKKPPASNPAPAPPSAAATGGSHGSPEATPTSMMNMNKGLCIKAIATSVTSALGSRGGHVDLSTPQIVVVVEILPLPQGKGVCAVSVLSGSMFDSKPRLAIKAVGKAVN